MLSHKMRSIQLVGDVAVMLIGGREKTFYAKCKKDHDNKESYRCISLKK